MDSAVGTTEYLQPNYANVQQKDENDHRKKYEPSGLVMLLIALAVIFLIIVILLAFAFHRYWRRRTDQKIRSVTAQSHQMLNNGTVATETQTYSPVKTPPQKPARSSLKTDQHRISYYENVLLDVSQGRFISQNDQFTPGTRDDVSWNLPFIDASRDCLDKIDQTEPVTENLGESKASYNIENIESQSQTDLKNNSPEREPMLDNNDNIDDEDDVFDDNTKCRLPRSPSEQIDLLFRISLSGENDA